MLFNSSELIKATGNENKARQVYEWAQGNPVVAGLSLRDVVNAYDAKHSSSQKEIDVEGMEIDEVETTKPIEGAREIASNGTPLFKTYNKINLSSVDYDQLELEVDELDLEDTPVLYKHEDAYYEEYVSGYQEVHFAPVADDRFKNYFITTDGVLVKKLKTKDVYKVVSPKENRFGNLQVLKRNPITKNREYVTIAVLVYKTFVDQSYDNKVILFADKDLKNLAVYNLAPYNLRAKSL